jgi:hypothetical protein
LLLCDTMLHSSSMFDDAVDFLHSNDMIGA